MSFSTSALRICSKESNMTLWMPSLARVSLGAKPKALDLARLSAGRTVRS